MSSKCLAISIVSLLISGSHSFTTISQSGHTLSRNYGSISVSPPTKFGVNGITTSTGLGLQSSHNLDTLKDSSRTPTKKVATVLQSSPSDTSASPTSPSKTIDFSSIFKYIIAAITQLSLFSLSFLTLDSILARLDMSTLPTPLTWIMFYAMSLRSRVLNPLNNRRPKKVSSEEGGSPGFKDRIMPSFTPPGYIFPIVWLIVVPSLRATSSTMVVNALGRYCDVTVMTLVFHLTMGDVWNTINNAEKRFGTSAAVNVLTYLSAVYASLSYGIVRPLAGKLLGLTCVWLTVASCLITQTWRLNLDENGKKDSILPMKGKGEVSPTKFWFQ